MTMLSSSNRMFSSTIAITLYALALTRSAVVTAETIVITDWVIPYTGPKTLDAIVGDTIEFQWEGFHNANIHPTNDCSRAGSFDVGTASPASYTFTEMDGSPEGTDIYFACDVGQHCANGQNVIVTVKSPIVNQEAPPSPLDNQEAPPPLTFDTGSTAGSAGLVGIGGLSTSVCSTNLPTSTGMAATKCALPPEQICCYGVQIEKATKCTCTGNANGRTYECVAATADACPDEQNPNVITSPPAPTAPPTVVVVENCFSAKCDPQDTDSCKCRAGLIVAIVVEWDIFVRKSPASEEHACPEVMEWVEPDPEIVGHGSLVFSTSMFVYVRKEK
eukprot:CAMPEP_0170873076 /NCGR_PEP_ID=MMETSP0734-20130129/27118_1 /TAXON_ID=186038 /ORGANISM="Fragilariopsis kerguelensis, Strain L26-C5" /LENGTH=331 /DNA_ID=CAMNT_0011253327 /DNA_START=37 /DNA_END=1033 /DNA_ORIENTATION=+